MNRKRREREREGEVIGRPRSRRRHGRGSSVAVAVSRFIAFTEEFLSSVGNGDVGAVIRIIRATCIEEDLLGGHVVAVEHVGEGLSLLGHAVSTPNVLAFSKIVLIVLGVYRSWACEFFVNHALHEASQRVCVGSRATRAATGTAL
jgi:hypothetical protein